MVRLLPHLLIALGGVLASFTAAASASNQFRKPCAPAPGISFDKTSTLPILTLPYAKYRAASYNVSQDYYVFKNIRFAAPPIGSLRWRPPAPPLTEKGIQDGSIGNQCLQASPQTFGKISGFNIPEPSSEDCLFLDVMVPGKAVRAEAKDLPILFWMYGGGYTMGTKSWFVYDGSPLLKSAGNNMIYVATNYRLGAFGFLTGEPLTSKNGGTANVGFHDQHAALQWVKSYISLVGGNPDRITTMGESAGAGSIMHHLTAYGGKHDPIFRRAILLSPAMNPQYDPAVLANQFNAFATAAGCSTQDTVDCLRAKSSSELQTANQAVVDEAALGTFGFGPSVDGTFVQDLPGLELERGNYWKNLDGLIVGHTSNEGFLFTDPTIDTDSKFAAFVDSKMPNASVTDRDYVVNVLYPKPGNLSEFSTEFERVSTFVGEHHITCNVRYVTKAYVGKAYNYVYSIAPGIHSYDLPFTFWTPSLNLTAVGMPGLNFPFQTDDNNLATAYQSYLTSFVRSGNPNKYRQTTAMPKPIKWEKSLIKSRGITALNVDLPKFTWAEDQAVGSRCDFWSNGTWTGR